MSYKDAFEPNVVFEWSSLGLVCVTSLQNKRNAVPIKHEKLLQPFLVDSFCE
jgi:hypothetical protein